MREVTRPADILVVTAPGCHYCDDALRLLDELGDVIPLTVRIVPLYSDEGRALIVGYRVPFPPILVVDGVFFGYGRISRRKLESHLAQRAKADLEV
ncbi:MAG TPA: glutaredoxin [Acidimicrobiia bacterium]|nr:glutaredoxin [Acidimicrobiia bacterium]